jgi:DNA-nicking Smr family endonuclease
MANQKVVELNLESGHPTVEMAINRLKNALMTAKGQGSKAVIIIHGYGSTGVGGAIRPAVRKLLGEKSMSGLVRAYSGGEQWMNRKKELVGFCKALEDFEGRVSGNEGVTVVVLR